MNTKETQSSNAVNPHDEDFKQKEAQDSGTTKEVHKLPKEAVEGLQDKGKSKKDKTITKDSVE